MLSRIPACLPKLPLNRNSGSVGAPPLPLSVGPVEQGVSHEGKLFWFVLRNLLTVDLDGQTDRHSERKGEREK